MKIKSSFYMGFVVLIFISMGAGCATTHKTTTTETTVQYPSTEDQQVQGNSVSTQEVSETTTTTESKPDHTGLIGGVFHVIGSIIALPFIFIGGLFRMIF